MALPKVALPTYELDLPSNGKAIKYRPFVVKEEKLLLMAMETEEESAITSAVKDLLKNCVQSRIKIDQLPTFDLEYLFLNIRAVSVGEEVDMTITCKDDNKTEVKYTFSLFDVKIDKPEGHDPKIELSDDMGIIFRYPTFPEFVKSSIISFFTSLASINFILSIFFSRIFDKCVFPDPLDPKMFSHLPGQLGQLSIKL